MFSEIGALMKSDIGDFDQVKAFCSAWQLSQIWNLFSKKDLLASHARNMFSVDIYFKYHDNTWPSHLKTETNKVNKFFLLLPKKRPFNPQK